MCIRDRPSTGSAGGWRPTRTTTAFGGSASSGIRRRTTSGCGPSTPVSYTHLTLPTICSV
eukprot:11716701-Alexandrium_andersonii.AAC.1